MNAQQKIILEQFISDLYYNYKSEKITEDTITDLYDQICDIPVDNVYDLCTSASIVNYFLEYSFDQTEKKGVFNRPLIKKLINLYGYFYYY